MLTLGLSGGLDPVHPSSDPFEDYRIGESPYVSHDAAAVLLQDGKVVAAVEEERLNRIKHTNKFPAGALRFCLSELDLDLRDIDRLAFYSREGFYDWALGEHMLQRPWVKARWSIRSLLCDRLRQHFGHEYDPEKLAFVDHHTAHALSASAMAPFDHGLVATLDGMGDGLSGTVFEGRRGRLEPIATIPDHNSLGVFYVNVIRFLGYRQFDEYKVMGLAPYGDPGRFRQLFRYLYTLEPNGRFTLNPGNLGTLMSVGLPRRQGEPFTQEHKDVAAALQEATEEIVFHHLKHYRETTGLKRLSFAGGLAHNCTLNGKLLRSGMFEDVFVQPASHDAGCALGAALCAFLEACPGAETEPLRHVFWGPHVGRRDAIRSELERWERLVQFRRLNDRAKEAARLLADGGVIGWVQNRSEFGPRALGNRSILADPRPAENKDVINGMVKKREGYRPFAPAVLEEHVDEYYDVPAGGKFPYMVFVVDVKEAARPILGAVTHVDGTARIQTVSRKTHREFWELIDAFRALTGVPILLNTSFNNNKEPIVDSAADAVACFLTTGLNYLVIGDYLVEKRSDFLSALPDMVLSLPRHVQVKKTRQVVPGKGLTSFCLCVNTTFRGPQARLSTSAFAVLARADGRRPLRELIAEATSQDGAEVGLEDLGQELRELWAARLVTLIP